MTALEVCEVLRAIQARQKPVALDIEGGCGLGPACVGFAISANVAFVVPFYGVDGMSIWPDVEDELLIWKATAALLQDPMVPKVIQNAPYEIFILAWTLGIVVEGLKDDTMLKHAELYAELEKALEFQAVLYTKQPFWKLHHRYLKAEERYAPFHGADASAKRATSEEWFVYNGTDCCVTYENNTAMDRLLKPGQRRHYEWNVRHLARTVFASLHGWPYDKAEADRRLAVCKEKLYELQDEINREAATSQERPALRQFYAALSPMQGAEAIEQRPRVEAMPCMQSLQSGLIPLLTAAFCAARRVEKREVEEVTYEPHHFNGKRWVKKGKRLAEPGDWPTFEEAPDPIEYQVWAKPHRKLVTRSIPVAVETLEDVRRFCKDSCRDTCKAAIGILRGQATGGHLSPAQRGELATLLGVSLKLNATGRDRDSEEGGVIRRGDERDANWFVYEWCRSPKHYTKEAGRTTENLTSNDSALISIWLETKDPRIKLFMEWRSLDTRREALQATTDPDGRIRCGYVLPGTETMRLACKKSPTGSGYNLQTVTEELRDLFRAPEGYEVGKFDLRGADGWSIAAECARLGDSTMLEDLLYKLKPVNLIVLMQEQGAHINQLSRAELKALQDTIDKRSWRYVATKPIFYGTAYLMGARRMSDSIKEDSYAETGEAVFVSPKQCEEIMAMIDVRYPGIKRWQEDEGKRMMDGGTIITSLGWQKQFFGRKADFKLVKGVKMRVPNRPTHGEWLGTKPQFYTTAATKLALERVWDDPTNRRADGSLRAAPIHTVHDELDLVWRMEDRAYVKEKAHPEWFNNPMVIAERTLIIPAGGTFGPSWGEQSETL